MSIVKYKKIFNKYYDKIIFAVFGFIGLFFIIFSWLFIGSAGIAVVVGVLVAILILISHKKNISIPLLKLILKHEYLRSKFRFYKLRNHGKQGFLNAGSLSITKLYIYAIRHLILLFKNSEDSFQILREDLFPEFSDLIRETDKKKRPIFARFFLNFFRRLISLFSMRQNNFDLVKDDVFSRLSELLEKVEEYKADGRFERIKYTLNKIGKGEKTDEQSLLELENELLKYNNYKKKRAAFFSLSTISTLVLAILSVGFITTVIFPQISKVRAQNNFSWMQTDWSGGASTTATALHDNNQVGWIEFFSKDNISTTTVGQLSLDILTTDIRVETSNSDFNAHATSGTYYLDGSVGLEKPNGVTCSSAIECSSGFCVDGYCCDTACTGSVCQTCDANSNAGAGTCGYAAAGQDPDNDCPGTSACASATCLGSGYSCGYLTGQQSCSDCNYCSGNSVDCSPVATDWNAGTYGCTGSDKRCYGGSCITCGGWMNAGYCWYNGFGNGCIGGCSTHGGVYGGNCDWVNDPQNCSTCLHFYPSTINCYPNTFYGPAYNSLDVQCWAHRAGDTSCEPYQNTNVYRFCACNR